jgi:hypothetical protein
VFTIRFVRVISASFSKPFSLCSWCFLAVVVTLIVGRPQHCLNARYHFITGPANAELSFGQARFSVSKPKYLGRENES